MKRQRLLSSRLLKNESTAEISVLHESFKIKGGENFIAAIFIDRNMGLRSLGYRTAEVLRRGSLSR